jgi:uncharacterized membrane protein YeaQ/YmgE (transglycosylase-associated protein family)
MGLIMHLIIGGIAGFLAGKLIKGEGYGIIVDIILGLVGGWVGGWLFDLLGITAAGQWGAFITAFAGACVLVGLSRVIKG